ncbi:nitronate monooxygenase [Anaerolineae bacterium]|nr:nitronate monooxygenase [Anaerolineae bacterium]
MNLPKHLTGALRLPVVVAPMFLVSGVDLVVAACRAGVIGSFPSVNARTSDELDHWLDRITQTLEGARAAGAHPAPYAVNLIVHPSNRRLAADMAVLARHEVPIVITSVGNPRVAADTVHAWGGVVYADVATLKHAERALAAGVDGLILLCAGAGGQTGWANPFAFVRSVRSFYEGTVILAGGIADGCGLRAAELLGADLAYLGTRFVATRESMAPDEYKHMLVDSNMDDVMSTRAFTGLDSNMLKPSIRRAGLDPETLVNLDKSSLDVATIFDPIAHRNKPWRDVWSAGHGVGLVRDVPSIMELVDRLEAEYHDGRPCDSPCSPH